MERTSPGPRAELRPFAYAVITFLLGRRDRVWVVSPWGNPMTILVADDDHVMTALLSGRLKSAGYSVLVAHDAMQAIMIALRTLPDAVLLDINMPGGTGMQVLHRLRTSIKTSLIPIVVISGSVDPETIANAKSAGADEYFGKPPDLDRLLQVLHELLHPPNLAKTTDGTASAHNCTPPE